METDRIFFWNLTPAAPISASPFYPRLRSGLLPDSWHLRLRQDLVARLLVNLGFCRTSFWYAVASGSGISRETGRIYLWNLT